MSKGATTSTAEINPDLLAMYKEVYSGAKSASEIDFLEVLEAESPPSRYLWV